MLTIDPTNYTPFDEEHWVLTVGQQTEIDSFRDAHPELEGWTRGQVSMAWGEYSEEAHQAGHLSMVPERNEEFLAFLVGKERGMFRRDCDPASLDAFRLALFPRS